MSLFNLVVGVSIVATLLLLFGGLRGIQTGKVPKNKAYLMIGVAIITALNLYMWLTMPPL